jgi:hypothetical protein
MRGDTLAWMCVSTDFLRRQRHVAIDSWALFVLGQCYSFLLSSFGNGFQTWQHYQSGMDLSHKNSYGFLRYQWQARTGHHDMRSLVCIDMNDLTSLAIASILA